MTNGDFASADIFKKSTTQLVELARNLIAPPLTPMPAKVLSWPALAFSFTYGARDENSVDHNRCDGIGEHRHRPRRMEAPNRVHWQMRSSFRRPSIIIII